ncbi:MAG: HTH-type transcriptional regulator CysB [Gammaproteobacteria bacterium]|nr:HTH-type transcriptional regulator CysB [Gammaproteobacteria bacterium]
MKLQQLRYIWEVSRNNLNVTATADSLFTSQPGISKQIRLLEDELGFPIFVRNGKHLTEITPAGKAIIELAGDILSKVENIRNLADEFNDNKRGELSIATTHTQARYQLPKMIQKFKGLYPDVRFSLHQGTPLQIADLASRGMADMAIATEGLEAFENLTMLPCYDWNRCILVPKNHPLQSIDRISLQDVAEYPIVTYVYGFTGRSNLDEAFAQNHLHPKVVLTAVDADVIKTYVRLNLGVGIIARMAYDEAIDSDLVAIDASHLFGKSTTYIGLRKDKFLRGYIYDFIGLFAPHLPREQVQKAMEQSEKKDVDALFAELELPVY